MVVRIAPMFHREPLDLHLRLSFYGWHERSYPERSLMIFCSKAFAFFDEQKSHQLPNRAEDGSLLIQNDVRHSCR